MADYTPEQLERMIASLRDSAGTMARAASSMERSAQGDGRDSALRKIRSDLRARSGNLNYAIDNFSNNIRDATQGVESFGRWFDRFLRTGVGALFGGAITSQLVQSVRSLHDTYKELNEVGQTFSGSMFEMARQAGAASLSLEQFSQLITRFSNAAAVLGRQVPGGLPALSHAVRSSARNFNMYGYSVEQLNEITGEYAETLRLQGLITQGFDITTASQQILAMAENAAAFSNATGRARAEINRQTNEALRDTLVTSRTQSQITDQQRSALNRATAFLASIPGDAGNVMSRFLAQSFGAGTAIYTEAAQIFSEAGFGQAISIMDRLRARVEAGEDSDEVAAEAMQDFVRQVDAANEGLRLQVMAGNSAARQVLDFRDQLRGSLARMNAVDRAQERENARVREGLTGFANRFAQTFNEVMGAFRAGFWEQIKDLDQALASFLGSGGGLHRFRESFERMGISIGRFLTRILTPQNIENFANGLERLVQQFSDTAGNFFGGMTVQTIGDTLGVMFRGIVLVTEGLIGFFEILDRINRGLNYRPLGGSEATPTQDRAWYDRTIGEFALAIGGVVASLWALKRASNLVSGAFRFFRQGGAVSSIAAGAGGAAASVADDAARAATPRPPTPPTGGGGPDAPRPGGPAAPAGAAAAAATPTPATPATPNAEAARQVATPATPEGARPAAPAADAARPATPAVDTPDAPRSAVPAPTVDPSHRLPTSTPPQPSRLRRLLPGFLGGGLGAAMAAPQAIGQANAGQTADAAETITQGVIAGLLGMTGVGTFALTMSPSRVAAGTIPPEMREELARQQMQSLSPQELSRMLEDRQRRIASDLEQERQRQTEVERRGGDTAQIMRNIEDLMRQQLEITARQGAIANELARQGNRSLRETAEQAAP